MNVARAWIPCLVLGLAAGAGPARAQERTAWTLAPGDVADSLPTLDREARFAAFQRDLARDFGAGRRARGRPPGEELALRMRARLERRLEDSSLLRWVRRGEGVYERAEGIYERIEGSTRWAGRGFQVRTELESVVDGRMRVEVEREVRGFRVAFDVRDASAGRFGAHVGGEIRGARLAVDVSDLAAGRFRLRLDKRFDRPRRR